VASCNEARGRQPGIKTAPDRGLTWARALHSFAQLSFAQLRQNRQNQLLLEVPFNYGCMFQRTFPAGFIAP
jgi:hypothetical protein